MSRRARMYVRADLVASSPIKLSSGIDDASDADVLVDATGKPFIPGTSLAGVMRHYVHAVKMQEGSDSTAYENKWFGHIVPRQDQGSQSLICVHDAFAVGEAQISLRDGVRLTDVKTVDGTGKYDYQVVDEGCTFGLRMEFKYNAATEKDEVDDLLSVIVRGIEQAQIMVGGKTSRGFGKLGISNVQTLCLDLGDAEDVRHYIDFDWETSDFKPFEAKGDTTSLYEDPVCVNLELVSTLMIRDYATLERSGYEDKLVDAQTLTGAKGTPIIPGTSWAGAFRHHMKRILERAGYDKGCNDSDSTERFLTRVFGDVTGGGRGIASRIEFAQSEVRGSTPINATRTAIDRFTGGAADQKLFTTRPTFGGTTTLVIRWRKDLADTDKKLLKSLIDVSVADLCDGTLAVGGMTATGSGMFRPTQSEDAEVMA